MKEMVYSAEGKAEILFNGEYNGYKFCIMNLGTHPTAYVECKLENCNSYGDERLASIDVHCGFTYMGKNYWDKTDITYYLGWDYAHYCDYAGYFTKLGIDEGKRWTTAEIYNEVKSVIEQLITLAEGEAKNES